VSEYTVEAVGQLTGISVRTLHHYDDVGLLAPSNRTPAGYRLYSSDDLRRLQQILFYRELGFGLEEIAAILADPDSGAEDHLRQQHRLLRDQIARRQALLTALEKEMEARSMGISLTPEEQLEIFGTDKVSTDYAEEAQQRFGECDAWQQSERRAAAYTKQDWVAIKGEADGNQAALVEALHAGLAADSVTAMELAEEHRRHISRWFYDCSYDIHRALAEMYLADPRFRATYEGLAPGLAQWLHDAILANATRATV
jgi:MerR family transcriptional regulator, thiopeptide resistance regulator